MVELLDSDATKVPDPSAGRHDHGVEHVDVAVAVVGAVGGRVVTVGGVVEPAGRQGRGEGEDAAAVARESELHGAQPSVDSGQADGLPCDQDRGDHDAAVSTPAPTSSRGVPVRSAITQREVSARPPRGRATRPGSASSTCTPRPSAAARAIITGGRRRGRRRRRPSRRTPGRPGRARSCTTHGTNDSTRARRNRSPTAARPAAARYVAPGAAAVRHRERHDEQHRARQGEPDGARLEQPARQRLVGRSRRASRSPVDEVVGPAEDRLAHQHRRRHEADLAQRAAGHPAAWPAPARSPPPGVGARPGRGAAPASTAGSRDMAQYRPVVVRQRAIGAPRPGRAPQESGSVKPRQGPLTCANAAGARSDPC